MLLVVVDPPGPDGPLDPRQPEESPTPSCRPELFLL